MKKRFTYDKILAVVSPTTFLKEVKNELSKVSWPTRQETFRLTLVVIIISVIVAAFIGGLDFFFTKLMTLTIVKR